MIPSARSRKIQRPRSSRLVGTVLAAGLVGASLPLSAGLLSSGASAEDEPTTGGAPAFGFATTTTATPIRIEIFEPTIPIPATPQVELNLGYAKVQSDTGSSRGRASFRWPGDAVGEGAKTIIENLGLPPELSGPIAAQGYPVQVNSGFPSGEPSEANEPFPGTIMRTSSSAERTTAYNGFSTDCKLGEPTEGDAGDGEDGGDEGPVPGLPPLPGIPGLGGGGLSGLLGGLTDGLTAALSGASTKSTKSTKDDKAAAEDEVACQLPAQLAVAVDLDGYASSATTTSSSEQVKAVSRSALGDVSLLGGIITLSGLTATATSSSDGTEPVGSGEANYGVLSIAGQRFRFGPDGLEAAGSTTAIPGLPDEAGAALKMLGITITQPGTTKEIEGDKVTTKTEALVIEIDTVVLQPILSQLPLATILDPITSQLPPEAGPVKSLLSALPGLAPKIVLHLATASSTVQTVEPGDPIPPVDPTDPPSPEPEPVDNGGTGGTTIPDTPGADTPVVDDGGTDTGDDGTLTDAAPAAAGLPPLFSIPGALLFGAIIAATVVGSYFRRLGIAALGGGAACPHGLDSGLPDLRKA